ncbi:hypothetical protein [Algoriphagus sp.]|uniref:hypothetical protein n=1 Tax=Algoriphagus sp. TaxID=1872435 RepID=UPI003275061F
MELEEEILEKLHHALTEACISPMPDPQFLKSRIAVLRKNQLAKYTGKLEYAETERAGYSSVCFAQNPEVQDAYKSEEEILKLIDERIIQLLQLI